MKTLNAAVIAQVSEIITNPSASREDKLSAEYVLQQLYSSAGYLFRISNQCSAYVTGCGIRQDNILRACGEL